MTKPRNLASIASAVLLLAGAYCAIVAYNLVFQIDWSERPGDFVLRDGYFQLQNAVHSHEAHLAFLKRLEAFAKGEGSQSKEIQNINGILQLKNEAYLKGRNEGLFHAKLAGVLIPIGLALGVGALFVGRPGRLQTIAKRSSMPLAIGCIIIGFVFGMKLYQLGNRYPSDETIASMERLTGGIFRDDPGAAESRAGWSANEAAKGEGQIRFHAGHSDSALARSRIAGPPLLVQKATPARARRKQ